MPATLPRLIATFGLVGYLRPAPGTWGSLAALPVFWVLHVLGGPVACVLGIAAAYGLGHWATAKMTAGSAHSDPGEIVIDEVAGQWVALMPVSIGSAFAGAAILDLWPGWLAGFALFRLFDILKPGPVGWADRRGDVTGVMLDDVIAGALAAICVILLGVAWHVVAFG
ncbi:phosphatidylglycerophosphatase A [Palleronia sediminis]|uniref:Phosphatidylglycerophosphatase A n=1 Tax=Palleronia sediminis TaxID=2547833 RepID=A0A4R6AK85_9RHOB|nr:phosphatidylglycerophosphatase A [Palleronia sediminis]TDL83594.1 phosphatidylglycerophosphatase A [Palleronia sediminis]